VRFLGSALRTHDCLAAPFRHMAAVTHASLFLQNHQVFMSTALGLLSRAPLRRLEFDQCLIDAEVGGRT
jgi:hypothetical protein